jgi:hypothetical protein
MKKALLFLTFSFLLLTGFSQSDKYMNAMQDKVAALDTTHSVEGLRDLSAAFERIGDAEKNQWLPYYYAALAQVNVGYTMSMGKSGGMTAQLDPIADKSEQLINKADELNKDNSEVYVVKKMIATLRMMADPRNRYMQYGPQAQQALQTAKKLNPENPRVLLLEAEDKFFTPEQFGGSKEEGKKLFEEALKKFDTFKPATAIDPNWGRSIAKYFLSQG